MLSEAKCSCNEKSLRRAERVEGTFARLKDATPLEITLAYLYSHPFSHTHCGPWKVSELEESLRASERE